MQFRIQRRHPVTPNLLPLIDVVLLLLIFFMISSTFVVQPGIKINLPKSTAAERREPEDVTLIITREETLYLNSQRVSLAELWGKLLDIFRNRADSMLVIKADRLVPHGRVVEVMDVAKQAGVNRLAIATEPKKREARR
ncbi:MAG: ExbD/TolR family protein [Nitrospinota bacterium]